MSFRIFIFSLLALAPVLSVRSAHQPFERYQSIIDRQMFGQPPPGFDPEKMPSEVTRTSEKELTKEQEKLQASVRLSSIRVSPGDEVYVSFSDIADPKNPRPFYLKVGETAGGWTVTEADPLKATATVVKDEVEVTLSVGGTSGKGGGGNVAKANRSGPASSGLLGGGSLSARRRFRAQQQAEAQRASEAKRAEEEERRALEREQEKQQREEERAEQRRQLQAIQEELRKARENKEKPKEEAPADGQDES